MEFILGLLIGIGISITAMAFCADPNEIQSRISYQDRLRFTDLQKQLDILQESLDELNRIFNKHINDGDGK